MAGNGQYQRLHREAEVFCSISISFPAGALLPSSPSGSVGAQPAERRRVTGQATQVVTVALRSTGTLPTIGFIPAARPVKPGVRGGNSMCQVNKSADRCSCLGAMLQCCTSARWWFKEERISPSCQGAMRSGESSASTEQIGISLRYFHLSSGYRERVEVRECPTNSLRKEKVSSW